MPLIIFLFATDVCGRSAKSVELFEGFIPRSLLCLCNGQSEVRHSRML